MHGVRRRDRGLTNANDNNYDSDNDFDYGDYDYDDDDSDTIRGDGVNDGSAGRYRRITGLVPVLATPFDATGGLDLRSQQRLAEWQVSSGADGVAVFGHASEGFALTAAEREQILRTVRAAVSEDRTVVAGVSATGFGEAHEQARRAIDGGADALMVLPPHLVAPGPEHLLDYYGSLGSLGVHVMIQDAPGNSRVTMPVDLVLRLAALDGVCSVKVETQPTVPKLAALAERAPEGFDVLGGQNALFCLEEYESGAVGFMPAAEFTDRLRVVLDEFGKDDRAGARAGFRDLLPLIRFGLQPGLAWSVHKHVMVRRGLIDHVTVRPPAQELDARMQRLLSEILTDLELSAV